MNYCRGYLQSRFRFGTLFLVFVSTLWGGAFCQTAAVGPAPVKTTATDLALEYVDPSGQVPPQLMMCTDHYAYPPNTSVRKFLAQPADASPEATLARYIQTLQQPSLDTRKANAFRNLSEDKSNVDIAWYGTLEGIRDVKLINRYDIGMYTFIEAEYEDTAGKLYPPSAFYGIRHLSTGYRITLRGIDPLDEAVGLFFLPDWDFYTFGQHWNDAPKPKYQYSFNMPGPFPANDPAFHPFTLFFNGQPSHLLIDSQTTPTGPISAFVKRAVQTYRTGTRSQWLALWTQPDIQEDWNFSKANTLGDYKQERTRFNGVKLYQVFTIDFGPNAVVFFADAANPSAPLSHLFLWKGASPNYHLTQGVSLKSGLKTFEGSLGPFFDAPIFQANLKSIITKYTEPSPRQRPASE